MNWKLKKIFTSVRVLIVLAFVIFALVAINPAFKTEGLAIRSVELNSSVQIAGIASPDPAASPRSREVVLSLNNEPVNTMEDFYRITDGLLANQSVTIRTNK